MTLAVKAQPPVCACKALGGPAKIVVGCAKSHYSYFDYNEFGLRRIIPIKEQDDDGLEKAYFNHGR